MRPVPSVHQPAPIVSDERASTGPVYLVPIAGLFGAVLMISLVLAGKIVCVGRNYVEHAAEHGAEVPKEPLLFLKPSTSVIGPRDAIKLPPQRPDDTHRVP